MGEMRRILIVEDEPNVRLVFRTALESNDYLLSTASDGEIALKFLKESPVDLVLLDLQMPGIDGMETLRRLRESGNVVPVVIVSAHDGAPNVVKAMRLGAIDFLSKPLTPDALRKQVAEVLSRQTEKSAPRKPISETSPLSQAKQALNRREFDRAEESLGQATKQSQGAAEAHYLLGVLHEIHDDRQAAYASYRAALLADPRFEPARLHLMKYFPDRIL